MAVPPVFVAGQVLTAAQMNKIGLWEITPQTLFSGASNIGNSGVFTSDFSDYLLVIRATTSTTGSGGFQLTLASVPASTLYSRQVLAVDGTTVTASRDTAQSNLLGVPQTTNGAYAGINFLYISRPALAEPTLFMLQIANANGSFTSIGNRYITGMHETATAYDGWSINMSAGTTTGTYTLYGFNK